MPLHDILMAAAGAVAEFSGTYPTVASSLNGSNGTATTSHTITMPTGVTTGDLLILTFRPSASAGTYTFSGWTQMYTADSNRTVMYYRISDGTEGTSQALSTTSSVSSNYVIYRINNWYGTTSGIAYAGSNGLSSAIDPPSLTAGWGLGVGVLWIAAFGCRNNNGTLTSYPDAYNGNQIINGSSGFAAMATRNFATDAEDPGTAPTQFSGNWVAATIAIRGA